MARRATSGEANGGLPRLLKHPRPVAQRDLVLRPPSDRRAVGLQREVVADAGNLLDQVLAGRIVPAINGVEMVGHDAGSQAGRSGGGGSRQHTELYYQR